MAESRLEIAGLRPEAAEEMDRMRATLASIEPPPITPPDQIAFLWGLVADLRVRLASTERSLKVLFDDRP